MATPPPVRFAVVGLEHPHAYGITLALLGAGAELAGFHSDDDAAAQGFGSVFGDHHRVGTIDTVLHDATVDLVVTVGVPSDRASVSVAALRHGHHVLSDKPAVTTADQLADLRQAQHDTGRVCAVWFSERFESRATGRAARMVRDGAVGDVVQVVGFGPHRLDIDRRPAWFFDPVRNGGILNDLASHQFDQFLHLTGHDDGDLSEITLVASLVANRAHPDHPGLEDYGEAHLRTPTTTATVRVDWFSPSGLSTWGDVRLFVVGTEGTIEVRKNCDLAGRDGGDHLFLSDGAGVHHIDCRDGELPFAGHLLTDVSEGGELHVGQAHTFAVCELALAAQAEAARHGHLASGPGR